MYEARIGLMEFVFRRDGHEDSFWNILYVSTSKVSSGIRSTHQQENVTSDKDRMQRNPDAALTVL